MHHLSRRRFLLSSTAATLASGFAAWPRSSAVAAPEISLGIVSRVIEVNGKPAKVFGIVQPNGAHGLVTEAGRRFQVSLANKTDVQALIHWHGLTPPSAQDGVPGLSQPALDPDRSYKYDFPLTRPGTNWMHSHVGFQEQQMMAAPLIVRDPAEAGLDEQEVVVLFHDFTFRDPEEIYAKLIAGMDHGAQDATSDRQSSSGQTAAGQAMAPAQRMPLQAPMAMDHAAMGHGMPMARSAPSQSSSSGGQAAMKHGAAGTIDLNDVEFDAYLANDRTLADPEVVRVEPGGQVRLRLINGAAATNFLLDLGSLSGELIAVDGVPIAPLRGQRFEFAIAQRLDIRLRLPRGQGTYPVLAIREGDSARTGIVLATRNARIARLPDQARSPVAAVGLDLERRLSAATPLPRKPADRIIQLNLSGAMASYSWTLNGERFGEHTPLAVRQGERVEITMQNATEMSHPMHLHGHHFQVVAIDGKRFVGAVRDTVLVPVNGSVTIAFDADNPGHWAFHCHNLYHMAAGMMTSVKYEGPA